MIERTGPLTWGQYLPWVTQNAVPEANPYFKILVFDIAAPAGVPLDAVLRILDDIVSRHEGLRTVFESTPSGPRQVVRPMRERGYRYDVSDAEPTDEPLPDVIGWLTEPFDLASEWPLRVAAWQRADGRWGLRLAAHRMILDHEGMTVLRIEFHQAFRTGSIEDGAPPSWEPLDIAGFEESPDGRRRDERSFAYWRRTLMTAPASLFATARPGRPTDSRFTVLLVRANLRPIVRELAAAFRVTEPTVLTASSLLALSWIGGWPSVCATLIANNRSHRQMRRSISPMLDRSLVNMTVDPGQTFGAWAGSVGGATIGAYKHSHADPNTLLRAFADVSMQRGVLLDRLPILNVMGGVVPARTGLAAPTPPPVEPPLPDDEYKTNVMPSPLDGMYLRARLLWRRVSLELIAGEQVFDLPTGERLVALIPSILESLAAHGDLALAKLAEVVGAPAVDTPELVAVDHTRVDLAAVRTLLRECEGVDDAFVFTRTDEAGGVRLHAWVAGDERVHDPHALRRAVIGRLPTHRQVLCPQWFHVTRSAPGHDSYEAWSAQPAVAEGSGWPAPPARPRRPAETALAEAVAAAHPPRTADLVDLGLPYCLVDGRFERIPELFTEFAGRGIEGITVDDLMGTRPLVHLLKS